VAGQGSLELASDVNNQKGNLIRRRKLLSRRRCLLKDWQRKHLSAWKLLVWELDLWTRSNLEKCSWHLWSTTGYWETISVWFL